MLQHFYQPISCFCIWKKHFNEDWYSREDYVQPRQSGRVYRLVSTARSFTGVERTLVYNLRQLCKKLLQRKTGEKRGELKKKKKGEEEEKRI